MRPFLVAAVAIVLCTGLALWLLDSEEPQPASEVSAKPSSESEQKPAKLLVSSDDEEESVDDGETAKTGELTVAVTSAGKPVPGAFVRLYSFDWPEGAQDATYKVAVDGTTGDDGRVKLTAARAKYVAVVRASGLPQATRHTRIKEKPEELLVDIAPGGMIKGRFVAGNSKAGVPNVSFRLEPAADWGADRAAPVPTDERQLFDSDAQGRFEAGPLEQGTFRVVVETPGFAKRYETFGVPRAEELVIKLFAAATIEGLVVDEKGAGAAGAKVNAVVSRDASNAPATADEHGKFRLEVNPGQVWLTATLGGASASSQFPIVVGAGGAVKDVKLVLSKGAAFEGTVSGIDGPVSDADVRLSVDSGGNSQSVKTDAQGHWLISGLPPATYHLRFEAKGYIDQRKRDLAILSGQQRRVDVQLEPAGRIEGTVTDSTGAPVKEARVMTMVSMPPVSAQTDAEGKFVLKGLRPGELEIVARGKTEGATQTKVTVLSGEVTTLNLKLEGAGKLVGKVRTSKGAAPVSELHVLLRPKSDKEGRRRFEMMGFVREAVKADGSYELFAAPGEYTAVVMPRSRNFFSGRGDSGEKQVTMVVGETVTLDFEFSEPEPTEDMLVGVVVDGKGAPAVGARVAVSAGRARLFDGIETDEEGRFSVGTPAEAPKEKLHVEAAFGGMRGVLDDVSPGDKNLRLVLTDAGAIEGRVSSTRVVQEFTLTKRGGTGPRGERTFTGDRFQLLNITAGPIELAVATSDGRAGRGTFTVEAGKVTEVVIEVKESATVMGRVSAKDMAEQPWVSLRMAPTANPRESLTARAEPNGNFIFQGLTGGEYEFYAYAGAKKWDLHLTVPQTGTVDVGEIDFSKTPPGNIGADYRWDQGGLVIIAVDKDGPASLAGVQVGDVMTAADGQPLKGAKARDLIRGAPGSSVQLTVLREGASSTLTVIRAR